MRISDWSSDGALPIWPPLPCPPAAARPRQLSVTRIETWMGDPYALYAREILHLRPLDPLDADPGAAERGTLVHAALEQFLKRHPKVLQIGRAHVCTPFTNAHLLCRLLPDKKT